jgi:hypothetical protein
MVDLSYYFSTTMTTRTATATTTAAETDEKLEVAPSWDVWR